MCLTVGCIASVCCVDRLFAFHDLCMQDGQLLCPKPAEMQVTGLTAGGCCKVVGALVWEFVMAQVEIACQGGASRNRQQPLVLAELYLV